MVVTEQENSVPNRLGRDYFLPDFCGVRMVFAVVIIAELLAFALSLGPSNFSGDYWSDLSLISLFIQWVALTGAALLCVLKPVLKKLPRNVLAVVSFFILMLQTLVMAEIARILAQTTGLSLQVEADWWSNFRWHCLGVAAIVNTIALRYFYVQHEWRFQIEAEAQARVDALQARIRPHFLFNSMNTIASLTHSDPRLAETVVEDLAELFRSTLDDPRNLVPLDDEVELAKRYLHIESLRLGERMRVQWELDDLPKSLVLPALSLQPLLENAIYHGIEPSEVGGTVRISGRVVENRAEISISNPVPQNSRVTHRRGNRMAQHNIQARLMAHFPDSAGLRIRESESIYEVLIEVPIEAHLE